jgi:hypothetical protein
MIKILHNLALFGVKKANFIAEKFGQNIFKIITSVPVLVRFRDKVDFRKQVFGFGRFRRKKLLLLSSAGHPDTDLQRVRVMIFSTYCNSWVATFFYFLQFTHGNICEFVTICAWQHW